MVVMVTFSKRTYASCHAGPPKTGIVSAPDPAAGHCQLMPLPQTPKHTQASLAQSLVGVTAPFSWVLVHTRFCLCPPRVCASPVHWKFCNQILLTIEVKVPGYAQSLYQIPRLGSLLCGLEL